MRLNISPSAGVAQQVQSEESQVSSPLSRTVTSDNVSNADSQKVPNSKKNSNVRQIKEAEVPEMVIKRNESPSVVLYQPDSTPNPEETPKDDLAIKNIFRVANKKASLARQQSAAKMDDIDPDQNGV